MFYIGYREKVEKYSCLKPEVLDFLVFNTTKWTSTEIIQIIVLGPIMAQARWSHVLHRLISKRLKHAIGADLIFFMLYLCYRRTVS